MWLRRYMAAVVPVCLVYVALPDPPRYLWTVIGALSLAGLVVGTAVNRPKHRLPWWLAACGVAALMAGDTTYDVLTGLFGQVDPFPSAADALYLAMYPLIAGGLLLLVRAASPTGDRQALLDAGTVTVVVGLLAWVYLAEPYAQDPTLTWTQKAVSVAYPLGDVLILAVLVRLLIGGRPTRALLLLTVGTLGLLSSDVLYGLIQLNGAWSTGGVVDMGWMLFYVAWGAAALSGDMTQLTKPVLTAALPTSRRRLLVFTLVPLVAPGMLLLESINGSAQDVALTAATSAILFLLVSLRLKGLVDAARRAATRENAMRRTGEALVAASVPEAVFAVGLTAVRQIIGHSPRLLIATGAPLRLAFDSTRPEWSGDDDLDVVLQRYGPELQRQQFVVTTAARCGSVLSAALGPDRVVLLAAMLRGDEVSGLLLVSGEGVDRTEIIDAVCALASQMMLAIDSIELTKQVAQRRSEAHFRSLFQHAADIILVLDAQLQLRFYTPSAQSVLGWGPTERGRSIESVVVAGDAARARLLLRRVVVGDWRERGVSHPDDEWRVADSHGDVRVFEVSCRNLLDDPNVSGVVVTLHEITERRKLESELKHQAFHDSLTQLPNRALFLDRVGHALARTGRHQERLAVILIDLDDFKIVNDTRGHGAGDELLGQVANRLRSALRTGDSCARLGGDEFAVLAEGVVTDDDAAQVAQRLREQFQTPFDLGGEAVTMGASIGVAISEYGADASELLAQADLAMYAAKDAGKGTVQLFRAELMDLMQLRVRKVRELAHAVERGEFVLHYQPIVCLNRTTVIGTEALLRWQHPERGLISPGDFIDIVEDSDLAIPIGVWVIDHAVAQGARWQAYAAPGGVFKMTLNVTPRELAAPGFVDTVVSALHKHGLPAQALVLEITERMLAGKDPQIVQAMAELQEIGVRLAVDDFGTGYSALGYLRRFPVSTLKIDRSFVAGLGISPDDHALVEAIIRLAETFDLDLVAEGVETEAQLRELQRLGCHAAQGYLFSRPMPAADAEHLLSAGTALDPAVGAAPMP